MLVNLRNRHLLVLDGILFTGSVLAAYAVRFEGFNWNPRDEQTALIYTTLSVPVKLVIFMALGLYTRLWRHAGIADLEQIVQAALASATAMAVLGILILPASGFTELRVPISILFLDSFFTITALAAPRMLARALNGRRVRVRRRSGDEKRVLIAGAGAAGEMIVRELLSNPQLGLVPVGFVDDDRSKHNQRLHNLPVLGSLAATREIIQLHNIAEIVIAMPTAPGAVVRKVVRAALDLGVHARTVPGLFDILSGRVGVSNLRKVEIQDLLRRAPVKTDLDAVRSLVAGETVMVTGAGGSIGSELCRQLARLNPSRLVLLGHGENSIFDIMREMKAQYPDLPVASVIADIRDAARVRDVLAWYQPYAVFHAAAHKHVPLMEENVIEAITNNVVGTRNVVLAAAEEGVAHFVMISTDKAVRPSSTMGASKRAAELAVQHTALAYGCNYVAVRFGNVLGSRGSVVPTFLKQIESGGPVTITHPEMRRFFMTIPEAVQLVLQAGAMGRGGEVFVLDMGEPVKIVDLANDLIRLSGLVVGSDIEIEFTGIRLGERLSEEMFFDEEHACPTEHSKILRARNAVLAANVGEKLDSLVAAARRNASGEELCELLCAVVPDYSPQERVVSVGIPSYLPPRSSIRVKPRLADDLPGASVDLTALVAQQHSLDDVPSGETIPRVAPIAELEKQLRR